MGAPNLTRADARARAALLEVTAYEVELDLTNGESIDVSGYAPEKGLELATFAEDNTLVVDADCIYSNTGEGLHRFVDPVDGAVYLYSQFETADAKRMYACFDQPDLKAPFTLSVTAPSAWEVVSNARPAARSEGPGGAQVVRFATTPPLSTYMTALVAGPYHRVTDRHDGIDLGVYCRASLAQYLDADEIFTVTKQGFDWYHHAFDYRYAFDKFDQLFVPEFNAGAMENAGCITFQEDNVFRSNVEKTWAHRQDQLPSTHPVAADIPDVHAVEVNFDGITYAKGASVLKQLAAYVGIDAFLRAFRVYFRVHAFGNTTLADLLQASVAILQGPAEPGGTLRNHRLAIGRYAFDDGKLIRVGRVEVDVTGERTELPELVGVPQPDLLLVNDDDLTYGKIRLDERSMMTVVERIADIDDRLARALCWSAAWDMTRDGEMGGRSWPV